MVRQSRPGRPAVCDLKTALPSICDIGQSYDSGDSVWFAGIVWMEAVGNVCDVPDASMLPDGWTD